MTILLSSLAFFLSGLLLFLLSDLLLNHFSLTYIRTNFHKMSDRTNTGSPYPYPVASLELEIYHSSHRSGSDVWLKLPVKLSQILSPLHLGKVMGEWISYWQQLHHPLTLINPSHQLRCLCSLEFGC